MKKGRLIVESKNRNCWLARLAALLCLCAAARADIATISYDDPLLSGVPGSVLTFTGTITNNTNSPVFLNQGSVNLASPFNSATDVSVDLLDWPISLDPLSTSADFAFFTVTIPDPFPGTVGPYGGTLLAQGGADGNALDSLNDPANASFAVDVTGPAAAVPEPRSFVALFGCFAAMTGLKSVLRFKSTSD
jgi:hypothetical protein